MNMIDNELRHHYGLLIGIKKPWQVEEVNLHLQSKKVALVLVWSPWQNAKCPVCAHECSVHDMAQGRTWRHLNTMQFGTIIRARTPREDCSTDGFKTIEVPWAEPHGRFTNLFEKLAIDVLLCARSIKAAAGLLNLSWDEVDHILRRAVNHGLSRQELKGFSYVGIDEKSFGSGQSYILLLTDL